VNGVWLRAQAAERQCAHAALDRRIWVAPQLHRYTCLHAQVPKPT